ncbi:glycosyltransferase family 4 protein [Williamsia sp. M5A3_1d]
MAVVMPHSVLPADSADRIRAVNMASYYVELGNEVDIVYPVWGKSDVAQYGPFGLKEIEVGPIPLQRVFWRIKLALLRLIDIHALHHSSRVREAIEETINSGGYDVVDVQHSFFALRLAAPSVLTVHNAMSNPAFIKNSLKRAVACMWERRALSTSERIVVFSPEERSRVLTVAPSRATDVVVVPLAHPHPAPTVTAPVRGAPTSMSGLFIGSMDYRPNVEAAREIITHCKAWNSDLGVRFAIVGRRAALELGNTGLHDAVLKIHSDVPDVREFYENADFVLLPIRSGGGVRVKALEALAFGIPVVATALAVDGLGLKDGESVLIFDGRESLTRCLAVLKQESVRNRLARNGRHHWERHFQLSIVARQMFEVYSAAQSANL